MKNFYHEITNLKDIKKMTSIDYDIKKTGWLLACLDKSNFKKGLRQVKAYEDENNQKSALQYMVACIMTYTTEGTAKIADFPAYKIGLITKNLKGE